MNKTKKWVPELQSFSGLAIIFVVLIHSTAYYLLSVQHKTYFEEVDYVTRLVDNLIHGAVPMFIFIAGYKYALNDIDVPYRKFVKSRVGKIFKPFLIISIIFFVKDIISATGPMNIMVSCKSFLRIFIGYNAAYQLWYVPMYFMITLTYPILCKIIKDEKIRIIFIIVVVITQYSLSWYSDLLASHPFDFIYYYLYFHMGLIFYRYDFKNKSNNFHFIIIAAYMVITLILTFNTSYYLSGPIKWFIIWPMSVVAYYFLVLKIKDNKLLKYLGKYSFYIFMLHEPIFCTKISYIFKSLGIFNSVGETFIIAAITIIVTMFVYKIIENTFINKLIFEKFRIRTRK